MIQTRPRAEERAVVTGMQTGAGHPSLLRTINRRRVVEAIREHGAMTRSQIAQAIGLSKPTVSEVFAGLEAQGLITEVGRTRGHKGPKASLYDVNNEAAWVVGVDVGHQWVRAALADLSGTIVARRDERARIRSHSTLVEQIGRLAHTVAEERNLEWHQVVQATVGSPGVVDPRGQTLLHAPNLPGWGRSGLVELIRKELGTDVIVENDVNLAALGELWRGHGREASTFAYVWIGTGVGMGLILGGELHRGAHGMAGEIGYLPIGDDEGDFDRGAFELAVSGDALVAMAEERGVAEPVSPQRVFALAREGDAHAREVLMEEARRVARGIAVIAPVIDPELIVLGGGIGHHADQLLMPLEQELHRISPFRPRISTSFLGSDAVLHGAVGLAASLAWERLLSPDDANGS